MQLAELNIATLKHDIDDPRVAGFTDNLDRINAIADKSDGFVWRLQDEANNATSIRAFDNPRTVVNLSVWQSPEQLEKFVWNTVHKQFYNNRPKWFEVMKNMSFVMWWVESGYQPTVQESRQRLEYLQENGPTDHAFGWESLPQVQLWKQARCG